MRLPNEPVQKAPRRDPARRGSGRRPEAGTARRPDPDTRPPVDDGSSLDELVAWITALARLHRAHRDDADAVGRIHAAARHALALFERVLGARPATA